MGGAGRPGGEGRVPGEGGGRPRVDRREPSAAPTERPQVGRLLGNRCRVVYGYCLLQGSACHHNALHYSRVYGALCVTC